MKIRAGQLWTATHAKVQARFGDYLLPAAAFSFLPNTIVLRYAPENLGYNVIAGLISLFGQLVMIMVALNPGLSLGAALRRVPHLYLPGVAVNILYGLATLIGLILLIVPGFYVLARLSAALPVLVQERLGVADSLRRSWTLTAGNVLPILAIVLTLLVILMIAGMVAGMVGLLFTATPEEPTLAGAMLLAAVASVFSIYYAALQASIYEATVPGEAAALA